MAGQELQESSAPNVLKGQFLQIPSAPTNCPPEHATHSIAGEMEVLHLELEEDIFHSSIRLLQL